VVVLPTIYAPKFVVYESEKDIHDCVMNNIRVQIWVRSSNVRKVQMMDTAR